MRLGIGLALTVTLAFALPYRGIGSEETSWTMAIATTRVDEPTGPTIDISVITAQDGELIGTCRFTNVESSKYRPVKVTIEGEWRDGFFWPAIRAQVGDLARGPWYTIPFEPRKPKLTKFEVLPGQEVSDWRIRLNGFLPYVGNYSVGRVILPTGQFAILELLNLKGAR